MQAVDRTDTDAAKEVQTDRTSELGFNMFGGNELHPTTIFFDYRAWGVIPYTWAQRREQTTEDAGGEARARTIEGPGRWLQAPCIAPSLGIS